MPDELDRFRWTVPKAGFRWETGRYFNAESRREDRFLIAADVKGTYGLSRAYLPLLSAPGLFKIFGTDVEPTEQGVLRFANEYGPLGGRSESTIVVNENKMLTGECLMAWRADLITMRRLVELWELIKQRDQSALSKFIRWRGRKMVQYLSHMGDKVDFTEFPESTVIASQDHRPETFSRFIPGDFVEPANWYLQSAINSRLELEGVYARLLWDRRREHLSVHIVPSCLSACLWLQFAKAVEGDKAYRQCSNCLRWMEVGGSKAARKDKKSCSPSCRASANRKKKEAVSFR